MMVRNAVFDLDGTLVDTSEGVISGVKRVFRDADLAAPDDREIASHIGPPLRAMLVKLLDTDDPARIAEGIRVFRQYYDAHGADEARPYEGVSEMLKELAAEGVRMMIVTNKPAVFAQRILERFGLASSFGAIVGQKMSGTALEKRDMLADLLKLRGLEARETVMIGDSTGDIDAARHNDVVAIAVTYGFTPRDAVALAAPDVLCESVDCLRSALLALCRCGPCGPGSPSRLSEASR